MKKWRVAIIGAGLIGIRRARIAHSHPESSVVSVADSSFEKAQALAAELGASASQDWREVLAEPNSNLVVVATPTESHLPIALAALHLRKHVLCEKPLARTAAEARQMVHAAAKTGKILKTGFNLRHHPAIARAREAAASGEIGRLLFGRCIYGHGGRPGMESEWRAHPEISGGGELMDQGVHVLDLFRWFFGEFDDVAGFASTLFWQTPAAEDNAVALLRSRSGALAQMHVSWTQWKNQFRLELFGELGYLIAQGLGGSYGDERLTIGRRLPAGSPPSETLLEFPGQDISWAREWQDLLDSLDRGRPPMASGADGLEALRLVEAIYRSARRGRTISLPQPRPSRASAPLSSGRSLGGKS